ncbi:MAG: hypothetical protein IKZ51_07965 [Bacteroidales bacterium]|nr:hypothetical protein [Bacteroidales bacterium]
MKKILFVFAAVSALCACTKDSQPTAFEPEPVTLKLNVEPAGTKAYVTENADLALDKVQVMVFNNRGDLETTTDYVSSGSQLALNVIPGTKTLWALGNLPAKCTATDLDELLMNEYNLTNNTTTKLIMSDCQELTITQSGTIQFHLKRLACKVVLEKIIRNFEETAYSEIPLYVKKVYLSNVANLSNLAAEAGIPSSFCVQMGVIGNLNAAGKALLVDENLNSTLMDGDSDATVHTFYAYPNGVTDDEFGGTSFDARRTRLIVECEYNGKTCYYPITLPGIKDGSRGVLERNKVYRITELILKRPGSPKADVPGEEVSSVQSCTFTIQVDNWSTGHSYTETFN